MDWIDWIAIIDWIAVIASLAGAWYNAKDVRTASVIWLVGNITFLVWGLATQTWSIASMNLIFTGMNGRALYLRYRNGTK